MGDQVPRPAPSTTWKEVLDHWILLHATTRPSAEASCSHNPATDTKEPHRPPPRHLHLHSRLLPILPRTPSLPRQHAPHTHESIGEPLWRNNRSAIAASTEPLPKNGPTISTPTESATSSAQAASSPPINGTTPSSDTRPITAASPTHGLMNANESDPSSSATSRPPSSARLTHPPPHSKTATSSSLSTRRCTPNATRDTRRAQTEDPTPSPSSVDRHDRLPTRDWQDAPHRRPEGHHARRPLDRHQQALQATLRRR